MYKYCCRGQQSINDKDGDIIWKMRGRMKAASMDACMPSRWRHQKINSPSSSPREEALEAAHYWLKKLSISPSTSPFNSIVKINHSIIDIIKILYGHISTHLIQKNKKVSAPLLLQCIELKKAQSTSCFRSRTQLFELYKYFGRRGRNQTRFFFFNLH